MAVIPAELGGSRTPIKEFTEEDPTQIEVSLKELELLAVRIKNSLGWHEEAGVYPYGWQESGLALIYRTLMQAGWITWLGGKDYGFHSSRHESHRRTIPPSQVEQFGVFFQEITGKSFVFNRPGEPISLKIKDYEDVADGAKLTALFQEFGVGPYRTFGEKLLQWAKFGFRRKDDGSIEIRMRVERKEGGVIVGVFHSEKGELKKRKGRSPASEGPAIIETKLFDVVFLHRLEEVTLAHVENVSDIFHGQGTFGSPKERYLKVAGSPLTAVVFERGRILVYHPQR